MAFRPSLPRLAGMDIITLAAATFALCTQAPRTDCVIDGDTFWLHAEKVRIADINAPETHHAGCPAEQTMGERAADRLIALLNAGPFTLEIAGARAVDRYGRNLRVVRRGAESIGARLVREGLAEPWRGKRSNWCALLASRS